MNPALPLTVSPRIAPLFRLQYEAAQEAWCCSIPRAWCG